MPDHHVVIDASAMVEVISALARLHRAGLLDEAQVEQRLEQIRAAPVERHAMGDLIEPAWAMRHNVRITDSVHLSLAAAPDTRVVTTDRALARAAPHQTRLIERPDAASHD